MTARAMRTTMPPRVGRPSPKRPRPRRRKRKSRVVTAQDGREAAAALAGVVVRTPLRFVEPLDAYLKLESLQPVGAFKLRGAYNAIRRLPPAARRKGVITSSSCNHGHALPSPRCRGLPTRPIVTLRRSWLCGAQPGGVPGAAVFPEPAPAVKVAG